MAKDSWRKALAKVEKVSGKNGIRQERKEGQETKIIIRNGQEYISWINDNGDECFEPGDWADVLKNEKRSNEGYELLAAAIIEQACKDDHKPLSPADVNKKGKKPVLYSADPFFESEWFRLLAPNIDGPSLLKQVRKNQEEFGTCYAMVEVDDPKHPGKKKLVRYQGPKAPDKVNPYDERWFDKK